MRVQVRIKEIAEQQGITARALAKKANVSQSTVERLFTTGDADNVSVGTIAQIAEALGVATRTLIVDTKNK